MEEKLKPCPFCGSTDIIIDEDFGFYIGCDTDNCRGSFSLCECQDVGYYLSWEDAIAAWNHRADTGLTFEQVKLWQRKSVKEEPVSGIGFDEKPYYVCPTCGFTIGKRKADYDCCQKCGQAILWPDD